MTDGVIFPLKKCIGARYMTSTVTCVEVMINSLAPGRYGINFKRAIFKLTSWIRLISNSYELALRRTPFNPTGDKSTLVQVMAWCRQATSHYLNQCWYRSMSPYGVTRPQWVKPFCESISVRRFVIWNLHQHQSTYSLDIQWISMTSMTIAITAGIFCIPKLIWPSIIYISIGVVGGSPDIHYVTETEWSSFGVT